MPRLEDNERKGREGHWRRMYHTQEWRNARLYWPEPSTTSDETIQWLGHGYYFWDEERYAHIWGRDRKCGWSPYHRYQVCSALIDCNQMLAAVFNENEYRIFVELLEKTYENVCKSLTEGANAKLSRESGPYAPKAKVVSINANQIWKQLQPLFRERWKCLLFADASTNARNEPTPIVVDKNGAVLPFRKRIQLVVYDDEVIEDFAYVGNYDARHPC